MAVTFGGGVLTVQTTVEPRLTQPSSTDLSRPATLAADVPGDEVERLVGQSYDLVVAGLTKKQKADLTELPRLS